MTLGTKSGISPYDLLMGMILLLGLVGPNWVLQGPTGSCLMLRMALIWPNFFLTTALSVGSDARNYIRNKPL